MKRHDVGRGYVAGALILLSQLVPAGASAAPGIPDFTFVQASDVHTPQPQSRLTIERIKTLDQIPMNMFGITAAKPAFAIVTGDLTEFGGGNGYWAEYLSYWKGYRLPVYNVLGNHDNTWRSNLKSLRDLGTVPVLFVQGERLHFRGDDERNGAGPTAIDRRGTGCLVAKVAGQRGTEHAHFCIFHHPLGGSEFASRYDYDRLLDVLREHNTVLLMAGHSHGHVYRPVQDLDQVTGGSTFGPNAGFAVYSVKSGVLRAAYWKAGEAAPDLKLLEKKLPETAPFPQRRNHFTQISRRNQGDHSPGSAPFWAGGSGSRELHD